MSGHKQLHGKHWIPHHQHSEVPHEQKIELVSIPSTSTYALNGQVFQIDFKEKGLTIMDMGLEIQTAGGISGLTGTATGYPNLNPASFWNTRIDVMIGGQVLFSIFNVSQFIRKQLFQSDEARLMSNSGEGLYSSATQRNALATASSYFYVDLWSAFKTAKIPFHHNYDMSVRLVTDTLANQVNQSTLTGTPSLTFTICNLLVKVLRHRPEEAQHHRNAIMKHPHSFRFVDELQQVFIICSGVTSWTQPLTSIIGNVSHLFFVLRSSLVDSGQFTFAPCMSWELLDSAGTSAGRQFNITTRYIIFQGIGWIRLI